MGQHSCNRNGVHKCLSKEFIYCSHLNPWVLFQYVIHFGLFCSRAKKIYHKKKFNTIISILMGMIMGPNVSTTPLRQWGFRQCLPFSWTILRGKHCRHPIVVMGVVDVFGHSFCINEQLYF